MDLVKSRYETFDELYEYCYRVAGTVALMTTPIMGIEPTYKVSLRLGTDCIVSAAEGKRQSCRFDVKVDCRNRMPASSISRPSCCRCVKGFKSKNVQTSGRRARHQEPLEEPVLPKTL